MTHEQYAIYSRLFDAALAAARADQWCGPSIDMHGNIPGEALRHWSGLRGIQLETRTLQTTSQTWDVIRAQISCFHGINVHLLPPPTETP